jgi:hypothetical protein
MGRAASRLAPRPCGEWDEDRGSPAGRAARRHPRPALPQAHGQRVQDQAALWHEKAAGNRAIDSAFHQVIGDADAGSLRAMNELAGEGITFQ